MYKRQELYHLGDDPGEQHNLAAQLPGVAARMRRELERRFGEAADGTGGSSPSAEGKKMDRDTEERLRALGYIE